ncbi:MAG: glycosyltransferase family 2 protein [Nitrolancea sp.]
MLILLETLRLLQNATLWIYAWAMRDPIPMTPPDNLRVAVLTTIVPSKEPIDMVAKTLRCMRQIAYDGPFDVWILDEGNDPAVRRVAAQLGVYHFSRNGRPEYNQPTGPFRARTKAGNHNAWRAEYEHRYDVVAQMDADHVPLPEFLSRTLGYFRDPDVAFVVAPQVYGNLGDSLEVNGAADQSYLFHGVVQRGGNGLDAPLLIGTNHVYRTAAWNQIGGYQDSIIEDHLTSLHVHSSANPLTGNLWKGVYTPDILAIGEGPSSWTDYFNQQRRWAYGVWDIVLKQSPRLLGKLPPRRALNYLALELFYPSVGIIWFLGSLLSALYLVLGITVIRLALLPWLALWLPTFLLQFALFVWLRRFNLAQHERRGIGWTGLLLSLAAGPIYVAAGISALLRQPLTYAVTAKSNLASADSWATFRSHVKWLSAMAGMLLISVIRHDDHWPLRMWAIVTLISVAFPIFRFVLRDRPQRMPHPAFGVHLGRASTLGTLGAVLVLAASVAAFGPSGSGGLASFLTLRSTPVMAPALDVKPESQSPVAPALDINVETRSPIAPVPMIGPMVNAPDLPGMNGTPLFGVFSEDGLSNIGTLAEIFFQWDKQPQDISGYVNYVSQRGQIPLITWEPRHGTISTQLLPSEVSLLNDIATGGQDDYLQAVATSLARTNQPIIIRFAEEMDLQPSGLHPWAGQDPATYVSAYRRVVDIFRQAGATNVHWLWAPSGMTNASGEIAALPYYPGDAYVDYTGFSAFIFWQWEEWTPVRQAVHAYRSPEEYLTKPVADLAALGHPVIISELGIDLYSTEKVDQHAWLQQAASGIVSNRFPGLVGVVYFDAPHNWTDVSADWRLTPDELNAFIQPFESPGSINAVSETTNNANDVTEAPTVVAGGASPLTAKVLLAPAHGSVDPPPENHTSTENAYPGAAVVENTAGLGVNLRVLPGVDATIVGTLAEGSVVGIDGPSVLVDGQSWWPVDDGMTQGWVAGTFLTLTP